MSGGPHSFSNSPTQSGHGPTEIETGYISSINVQNMTVDWVSQYTGKYQTDVPMMSPYVHRTQGEGFTVMPEVGAIALMCWPCDDAVPFILGFLSAPEKVGAKTAATTRKDTGGGDTSKTKVDATGKSTASGGTPNKSNSDASYRAKRPILNPGDMMLEGRDENFVVLRRGGVLQLGSTQVCQRFYVPLLNTIRDFCENWEMNTAAGSLDWEVKRQAKDPTGNAPTELTLIAREYAQDKNASIKVWIGGLNDATKPPSGDKTYFEVTIAPEKIDPTTGKVTGTPKYVLRVDKAGNTYMMQAKNRTEIIKGNYKETIYGNHTETVKGNQSVTVKGNQSTDITGSHKITGTLSSTETWTGMKSITAATTHIGSQAAIEPAVLGFRLVAWLASHIHVPFLPPVTAPALASILSQKVFLV